MRFTKSHISNRKRPELNLQEKGYKASSLIGGQESTTISQIQILASSDGLVASEDVIESTKSANSVRGIPVISGNVKENEVYGQSFGRVGFYD